MSKSKVTVTVGGDVGVGKSATAGVIAAALRFIGINVTWVGEEQEKNLVGGNWVDQLLFRKPEVRIIEEGANISKLLDMNFGEALEALKAGKRVQRKGWNGKGMFIYLVPENKYPAQTGAAKAFFGENALVPYNAYFAIKNVNETVSTWVPSVNDCLADDWSVIDID